MNSILNGTFTALVTPLRDDKVDAQALRALVQYQLDHGVKGLVPVGTTGEAVTLTEAERDEVIALTLEAAGGRAPVLAGVGSNDTRLTIAAAKRAQTLGAQGLLVVTPYYNKPTQEGMFRHFAAVAEAVDIELCVYNVPGRTGVNLEPATMARLLSIPNITGIKDATGNLMVASELSLKAGERMRAMSGDDFTTLGYLAQGGHGVISVASNVDPRRMSGMVEAALKGDFVTARRLHFQLYGLFQVLFVESNPIPVKYALARMGLMREERRLPLCPPSESTARRMDEVLSALELLPVQGA